MQDNLHYESRYLTPLVGLIGFTMFQVIFVVGLSLLSLPSQSQLVPDSSSYLSVMNLFPNHYSPDEIRTIGYPFLLYLINQISAFIGMDFYHAVFAFQFSLLILSMIIWSTILRNFIEKKYIFWFVILAGLNPSGVVYSFLVSTEITFLFFISIAFYFASKYFQYQVLRFGLLALLLFCCAVLIRPGFYYFNLLLMLCLFLHLVFMRRKYLVSVLVLGIYMMTIGLNQLAFFNKFHLAKLSTIDQITQYRYLSNRILCLEQDLNLHENLATLDRIENREKMSLSTSNRVQQMHVFYDSMNHEILVRDYWVSLKAFCANLFSNFHTGNSYLQTEFVNSFQHQFFNITRIFNMTFILLLLIGNILFFIKLVNRKYQHGWFSFLLLSYANYVFITSGISFWQGDRFNIVWFFAGISFVFTTFFEKKEMLISSQ